MSTSRLREIIEGARWAFRFANPCEILLTRHFFRRKRSVIIEHGGLQMLIDSQTSDAQAVTEVLLEGMYDSAIRLAAENCSAFSYLNLGANIGAFDVRIFELLRGQCLRIAGVAVEMNPATHARLLLNLELNSLRSVHAINAAAWDTEGVTHVRIEERDTGQKCGEAGAADGWSVPLVTWRELFGKAAAGPVDLVKIDIEGAERKVVPQMTEADRQRIRFLVIETHGAHVRQQVGSHLQAIGFQQSTETPGDGETWLTLWKNPQAPPPSASPNSCEVRE